MRTNRTRHLTFMFFAILCVATLNLNCEGHGFSFLGSTISSSGVASGGGGIDGMRSYFSYGPCGGGSIQVSHIIVMSEQPATATMTRKDCVDLTQPVAVDPGAMTFGYNDQSVFAFAGNVYDLQTAPSVQRITMALCSAQTGAPLQAALWGNLGALGEFAGSVSLASGATTGPLTMVSQTGNIPGAYQSAAGQPNEINLNLPTSGTGILGYVIGTSIQSSGQNVSCVTQLPPSAPLLSGAVTNLHYSGNANFDGNNQFLPASAGFNVADVSTLAQLNGLPPGVVGLVWLGLCNGADANFISTLTPFVGNSKVFGFYLMDNPDPTGKYSPLCSAANLKAEADWIHGNIPAAKTFIVLMNMGSDVNPTYAGTFNSANTDIDLFGLNPYPCQTQFAGCNYEIIGASVAAAKASGISAAQIVPVYQAFSQAGWIAPNSAQEAQILMTWAVFTPAPVFEDAYSWGLQGSVSSLQTTPALQSVFLGHNSGK